MKTKLVLLFGLALLMGSQQTLCQVRLPTGGKIVGLEQYGQYKRLTFYDDMLSIIMPKSIDSCYYAKLIGSEDIRKRLLVIDTLLQTNNIMDFSREAQDGYLQVNKDAMTYIEDKGMDPESLKLEYEVDGVPISTCESVKTLVSLTAEQLKSVEYVDPSPDNGNTLTVRITTLKGNGS